MVDERTIAWYDNAAAEYEELVRTGSASDRLQEFMALLPKGASVLDLGCGPAIASVHMRAAGFRPDPVDASQGLIDLANQAHDISARYLTFDDLDMVAAYDGVWANFSLLHAPRADLPRHLAAIATALRDRGVFHIGMKVGTGEERDRIDRKYTYVTIPELHGLLEGAGFDVIAVEEGEERGSAGTVDPFVIMRARKRG
ncbi:class I SAM-dependent DNA methyltransferase [Cognatiyoonia sp. IB215182]|uniref:class I SAM-dependent DNA methyltransferase n=1 Tax=Cognatiyoonia sp. IB215182 TaxID=3097353 RepID=UPI002A13A1ED|nr:methyltransferase domain-containing protein [Cognatiyoonia sp. IB215182]MDX8354048.1 methyltransferase domain-containing protein [Cognatiyoonia sp. IB215182]